MTAPRYPHKHMRLLHAVIVIASAAVVAVAAYNGAVAQKDVATSILALLGTFLGATFAFRLNEDKEAVKLHATRREALNRVMFVLTRQHNAIHQLKSNLNRYGSQFERGFNLPAIKPPPYADLIHNFADLEFLLESPDPNLLLQLTVEQERFHQALDSLRIRNEFYVNEVQPALARLSLNGKVITADQAAQLLGERLFGGAMNGAAIAHQHICASSESLPVMHAAMRKLAKAMYPGHKFLNYEMAT
jgi:hypothetical protein